MGGAGALDQLDRLVDRRVVGRAVGEEQLVEAEAQGGDHRRVEQPRRAFGEALDRRVGGAAALHGAEGEALRLGALATGQLAASAASRKKRSVWASRSKVARIVSKASARAGAIKATGTGWPRR